MSDKREERYYRECQRFLKWDDKKLLEIKGGDCKNTTYHFRERGVIENNFALLKSDRVPAIPDGTIHMSGYTLGKSTHMLIQLKDNITGIELFTHDKRSERTASGTVAATIVGSIALGPLGGIAGAMWGGARKKTNNVGFGVQLKDGRQFIAEADFDVFVKIKSYVPLISTNIGDSKECPMCAETVKDKAKICRFCQHKF
jgi:hypothetical protein